MCTICICVPCCVNHPEKAGVYYVGELETLTPAVVRVTGTLTFVVVGSAVGGK